MTEPLATVLASAFHANGEGAPAWRDVPADWGPLLAARGRTPDVDDEPPGEDDPALRVLGPHGRQLGAVLGAVHEAGGAATLDRDAVGLFVATDVVDPEPDVFVWSVWVEVDEDSMATIARTWSDPNRAANAPLTGRLATELPYEQPTRGLQITIYTRDPGMTPLLMLSSGSGHTLAAEQRNGVSLHRVAEFSELVQR